MARFYRLPRKNSQLFWRLRRVLFGQKPTWNHLSWDKQNRPVLLAHFVHNEPL